jgi:DNA polymerase III epsilon subunit-like protein
MQRRNTAFLKYDPTAESKRKNPVRVSIPNEVTRQWMLDIPREEVVCLDLETTGLYPRETDEVLQVSICDGTGLMLLDSYVRPEKRKRWPNAERIHGITPAMVKDSPTLKELGDLIYSILDGCTLLIGYNIRNFDLEFLKVGGVSLPNDMKVYDLINDCSVLYGTWNDRYRNYSYISLEKVTRRFAIVYEPHDSYQDVLATIRVFYEMLDSHLMRKAIEERKGTAAKPTTTVSIPKPAPTVTKRPTVVDKPVTKKRQTLREWVESPPKADVGESMQALLVILKWTLVVTLALAGLMLALVLI